MKTQHAADWKAQRRWRALELKRKGWWQQEIAEALGVSTGAVSRWMKAVERGGQEALHARPRSGAPPRLTPEQLGLVPDLLSHGTEAYGFRGEVWTCARVAQVIKEEFGVSYHKAHVSRLLKQLHWTPQMPIERASQRDEAAIERWRIEVWPMVKKKRRGKAE
jgi:transposase